MIKESLASLLVNDALGKNDWLYPMAEIKKCKVFAQKCTFSFGKTHPAAFLRFLQPPLPIVRQNLWTNFIWPRRYFLLDSLTPAALQKL